MAVWHKGRQRLVAHFMFDKYQAQHEHDGERVWKQHSVQNPSLGEKIVWHLTSFWRNNQNFQANEATFKGYPLHQHSNDEPWSKNPMYLLPRWKF